MLKVELTKEEEKVLESHFHKSDIELIRLKAHASLLHNKNYTHEQIADILFKDLRTIQRWLSDFVKYRIGSIFSFKIGNDNAAKLTKQQKQSISKVLQQPVTVDSLLPKKFWDVDELKKYVHSHFGVVYESERSYHFLLKQGELSFKYPDAFNVRRDENLIQKRMKEIKKEVKELMKNSEWEVLTSDETGLQEKNLVRKAWLKKNKQTVVKISMEHENQSFIGFLNQKNHEFSCYEIERGNQEEMIRTIGLIKKKYPKKKICILWDNAGFHKGKKIRDELKPGGKLENVYFINFPPYAPEYNPVEHVWNTVKQKISKYRKNTFKDIINLFKVMTHSQKFKYNL